MELALPQPGSVQEVEDEARAELAEPMGKQIDVQTRDGGKGITISPSHRLDRPLGRRCGVCIDHLGTARG